MTRYRRVPVFQYSPFINRSEFRDHETQSTSSGNSVLFSVHVLVVVLGCEGVPSGIEFKVEEEDLQGDKAEDVWRDRYEGHHIPDPWQLDLNAVETVQKLADEALMVLDKKIAAEVTQLSSRTKCQSSPRRMRGLWGYCRYRPH